MVKTILVLSALLALANAGSVETENEPVVRVLANLEAHAKAAPKDAALLYALARVHALIYAQSPTAIEVRKSDGMPYEGSTPRYQPLLTRMNTSKSHLKHAFYFYNHAGLAGYNQLLTTLGIAWCGELNSPDPRAAIVSYRLVFADAWAKEKAKTAVLPYGSVAVEVAGYLLKLLDPKTDAAEIADLKKKISTLTK